MSKKLAILSSNISFGMRDMDYPAFWFSIKWGEELSSASLIILSFRELEEAVIEADIKDVTAIKGQPCQIDVEGNRVKFIKFVKVK